MQSIICMKWGTRYPSEYVNRLWSMIQRHTKRPTRLICFTDDDGGVHPEVQCLPLPKINIPERVQWLPWRKVSLWQRPLSDLEGDVLFLDLDVVVTGSLDDFFDFEPGKFCVAHNWSQPNEDIGNTSVYRFPVGKYKFVFDDFDSDPEKVLNNHKISQQYISAVIPEKIFWPVEWCLSFKFSLIPKWPLNFVKMPKLPATAKVIAFTGKPDPDEAAVGRWPVSAPWKRLYKYVRPTPWIDENWR